MSVPARLAVTFCSIGWASAAAFGQSTDAAGFKEDFDRLDAGRWSVSDGWVNGDHQNCSWSKDRVAFEDGVLMITLLEGQGRERDYSCGEIQSNERFGFGTYEARIRVPSGSGINANFFTHIGAPQKSPHNEIDFEFLGKSPDKVQLNYFADGLGKHEFVAPTPGASTGFHDYAIVWEPDRLRWFMDGRLLHETQTAPLPAKPQKIYFSLWATDTLSDWLGPFAYPGRPLVLDVDWVAFTPLGRPCAFEGSAACGTVPGGAQP